MTETRNAYCIRCLEKSSGEFHRDNVQIIQISLNHFKIIIICFHKTLGIWLGFNKFILFALWWSSLLIGEGIFESFHTWLIAPYSRHNWASRWFPTLIMRISHLIQTIQRDPQILTSVHGGYSFSKKKQRQQQKKLLNKAYFILIFLHNEDFHTYSIR